MLGERLSVCSWEFVVRRCYLVVWGCLLCVGSSWWVSESAVVVGVGGGLSWVHGVAVVAGGGRWLLWLGWLVVKVAGVAGGGRLAGGEAWGVL